MASKEEIRQKVDDIRKRAILSLIKNLITGFGGPTAGAALFQANEDLTQLAKELKEVQQEVDNAPFTIPEVTVYGTPVMTIPETVISDDDSGEIMTIPETVIGPDDGDLGEGPEGGIPATPEGYSTPGSSYGGGGGVSTAPGDPGIHGPGKEHRPFHSPPGDPR